MLRDFIILTLKGVRHRPMRSWLTIIGIVIGIMLVVVIFSLSSGIQSAISHQLQMFGSDLIIIFPGKETNPLIGLVGGQRFKERDLLELEKIDGVKFVVPTETLQLNVEYKGEKKSVIVHGAPWRGLVETFETSKGVRLQEGRWPENEQAKEAVLGYLAYNKLFKNPVRLNDEIIIKSKRLKAVGYVSQIGNQFDDNVIYVSMELFRQITGTVNTAASAFVEIVPGFNVDLVAEQIRAQLSKQEVVREFSVLTPAKAEIIIGDVLSIVELGLIAIAFISLVVGAVGIMNTMYTSVLERTKQIGVMKAVGASNDAILSLFLIESGMIGLVGGIMGIVFGLLVAWGVSFAAVKVAGIGSLFSFASLDFLGLFVVLIITFIAGVISGILPARRAAKMEPAEALRYE